MRTRYGRDEFLVALASKVYVGIAVCKLVRGLGVGEMTQHGLLHRELLPKISSQCYKSEKTVYSDSRAL